MLKPKYASKIDVGPVIRGWQKVIAEDAKEVKRSLFEPSVRTWNRAPTFSLSVSVSSSRISSLVRPVGPNAETFYLVSAGSPSHPIHARRKPALKYKASYNEKTTARRFGSRSGGKYGPWVSRQSVMHPGFEGRLFIKTALEQRRAILKNRLMWVLRTSNIRT